MDGVIVLREVIDYYNRYDEDGRLDRDNYHRTELLLTLRLLKPYLVPGGRILDAGAGTGRYSCFLAERGYSVTALDLTPKHVEIIRRKAADSGLDSRLSAVEGDARDLARFEDGSFDVVLCMGPLYHLRDAESRETCIRECLRVLRKGGILAAAYVNRAGVYLYMISCDPDVLLQQPPSRVFEGNGGLADKTFVSLSPAEMEDLMSRFPLSKKEHAAADGISAAMHESVNRMDPIQFERWLEYLYYTNREPAHLGTSLHNLYIAEKR